MQEQPIPIFKSLISVSVYMILRLILLAIASGEDVHSPEFEELKSSFYLFARAAVCF
jgi:hypothetical protein